jgi:opacity protein-like surface antigen
MNQNLSTSGNQCSLKALKKVLGSGLILIVGLVFLSPDALAFELSARSRLTPFVEVRETFDDNVFLLSEGEPLPINAKSKDDSIFNLSAGVGLDVDITQFITLGLGYRMDYQNYADNNENDQFIHALELKADVGKRAYFKRLTINIKENLTTVPIDTTQALLPGNKTFRNEFQITPSYRIIDTKRTFFDAGYSYRRIDYTKNTVQLTSTPLVTETTQVVSNSQSHGGVFNFGYILNPRLTLVTDYNISRLLREKPEPTEIVDPRTRADITRQRLTGGVNFKLSPRLSGLAKIGFETNTFSAVEFVDPTTGQVQRIDQRDRSGFAANFGLNFNITPSSSLALTYDRFFSENDFGETLETDDVISRLVLRLGDNARTSLAFNYRHETRELIQTPVTAPGIATGNDSANSIGFAGDIEYMITQRIRTFGGYKIANRQFFSEIFFDPTRGDREDTTQTFTVGVGYSLTRYLSINTDYEFIHNDSNFDIDDYNVNRFSIFSRATF